MFPRQDMCWKRHTTWQRMKPPLASESFDRADRERQGMRENWRICAGVEWNRGTL